MKVSSKQGYKESQSTTFKGKVSRDVALHFLKPLLNSGNDSFSKEATATLANGNATHESIYQVYLNGIKTAQKAHESITGMMSQLALFIPHNKKTSAMLQEGSTHLRRLVAEQSGEQITEKGNSLGKSGPMRLMLPVLKLNDPKVNAEIANFAPKSGEFPRQELISFAIKGIDSAKAEGKQKHAEAWLDVATKALFDDSRSTEHDIKMVHKHFGEDEAKTGVFLVDVVTNKLFGKNHDVIPQNAKMKSINHENFSKSEEFLETAIQYLHKKNEPFMLGTGTNMTQPEFNKIAQIAKRALKLGDKKLVPNHATAMSGYYENLLAKSILKKLDRHIKPNEKPLAAFLADIKRNKLNVGNVPQLLKIATEHNRIYDERHAAEVATWD